MGKKNDNTLVKNASFLMIAALISKIIGMLYKSPLSSTLGNSSMGLFNYAQNVYFILLMIGILQHSSGCLQNHGRKAGI